MKTLPEGVLEHAANPPMSTDAALKMMELPAVPQNLYAGNLYMAALHTIHSLTQGVKK